jgi:hypothetical protein
MVTPDAFTVSSGLLGMPLAPPSRRLFAILVDLLVIGLLTALTKSFALVLGVVIAVLLVRAGFKRVTVPGSAWNRAMRASVGCLGVFIGFITMLLWAAFGIDMAVSDRSFEAWTPGAPGTPVVLPGLAVGVTGATAGIAFANAPDLAAAEAAGAEVVAVGRDLGLGAPELRDLLEGLVPSGASWAPDADALIDRLVAETEATGPPTGQDAVVDETAASDTAPTLAGAPESDSLALLTDQIAMLAAEVRRAREEAAAAEAARSNGGLFSWLRRVVDELGFGFGWATLYMTVILPWWKGQTVGKRLLGIRVVRLDGEPITWWTAFERAGGYAAGFATGLLGFAQVYWDANRQAIHDRIVGTVVVREGKPKDLDWESAL